MGFGFFNAEGPTARIPLGILPRCGLCKLHLTCLSPKMPVAGEGQRKIMIIGEAPGKNEDDQNKPLVGASGQKVQTVLDRLGVDLFRDCWILNALACRPMNNATPTDKQVEWCRPNVSRAIDELKPETIILLGGRAVKSVLGPIWREDTGGVSPWTGWNIPSRDYNAWVCPTWHPSYLLHQKQENPVLERYFEDHLRQAVENRGRPWPDGPPDYTKEIERIYEPEQAAKLLRKMIAKGGLCCFDYETSSQKPDAEENFIHCASVCWQGKRTIAFPWGGAVIPAFKEWLRAENVRKMSHNASFEARWSKAKLGVWPRGWVWDSMVNAHILDNRSGITGLKFQVMVRLGQGDYDSKIKPYLKAAKDGGNMTNRVKEAPLDRLLLYCGLDSLLQYKVAMLQTAELGITL